MAVKRVKFQRKRAIQPLPKGGLRRSKVDVDREVLSGMVQGWEASAGEERLARALDVQGLSYQFRMALGGARNTPGWKELDFLVQARGMYFAVEVDSEFTHRHKKNSDVLHDAITLNELKHLQPYPRVFHLFNEHELVDQGTAIKTVRSLF